jgi:hypothetical protein
VKGTSRGQRSGSYFIDRMKKKILSEEWKSENNSPYSIKNRLGVSWDLTFSGVVRTMPSSLLTPGYRLFILQTVKAINSGVRKFFFISSNSNVFLFFFKLPESGSLKVTTSTLLQCEVP